MLIVHNIFIFALCIIRTTERKVTTQKLRFLSYCHQNLQNFMLYILVGMLDIFGLYNIKGKMSSNVFNFATNIVSRWNINNF